jgi:hypothetical protein
MQYAASMDEPRTAQELWPLVEKLPRAEQLRLAKLALRSGAAGDDRVAYLANPPREDEFGSDEDPLAWEAEGWEDVSAPG